MWREVAQVLQEQGGSFLRICLLTQAKHEQKYHYLHWAAMIFKSTNISLLKRQNTGEAKQKVTRKVVF